MTDQQPARSLGEDAFHAGEQLPEIGHEVVQLGSRRHQRAAEPPAHEQVAGDNVAICQ